MVTKRGPICTVRFASWNHGQYKIWSQVSILDPLLIPVAKKIHISVHDWRPNLRYRTGWKPSLAHVFHRSRLVIHNFSPEKTANVSLFWLYMWKNHCDFDIRPWRLCQWVLSLILLRFRHVWNHKSSCHLSCELVLMWIICCGSLAKHGTIGRHHYLIEAGEWEVFLKII